MDCFLLIDQLHWEKYARFHYCEHNNYDVNMLAMCFVFSLLMGGTLFASLLCRV